MKFVNENIEDILQPKDSEHIKNDIKKLSWDQKMYLVEELWNNNWYKVLLDISKYLGDLKFEEMIEELIIMKEQE